MFWKKQNRWDEVEKQMQLLDWLQGHRGINIHVACMLARKISDGMAVAEAMNEWHEQSSSCKSVKESV